MVRYVALAFEDAHLELHMVRDMLVKLNLAGGIRKWFLNFFC